MREPSIMKSIKARLQKTKDVIYKEDEPIKLVGVVVWWQAAEMME